MKDWLIKLLTDKDGDADEMAILTIAAVLTYLYLGVYSVVMKGQVFDPQSFGIGLGGLIGAAAAAIGYKSSKE